MPQDSEKKFETEVRLSREMTMMDATMIGVGAMIGAGIFVLTGIAAGVAGPALLLVFALNGIVAIFTAMSYAELGSCYHDAGGGYLWVKEGLPKWNGFIAGWMSWFAHAVACSLYALGFGAYFGHVLNEFGYVLPYWDFLSPQKTLACIAAVLFAYINFRGASETGRVGTLVTLTKIAILAVFIGLGLEFIFQRHSWMSPFSDFMPNGWSSVFKAMGLTFIAFQGFEVIAQSSEEIKNPKKNIPRAVFLSLAIVIPIYLLVAFTALAAVRPDHMTPWDYLARFKETALVEVARNFFDGGGVIIIVGGLVSTLSALNATVYSSSRVAFAMGRDRNFPALFNRVHARRLTPHWAILFSLIIIVTMAVTLPVEDVASAADIMFLLLFLQVNIAMVRLRKMRPDLDRGFVTPLFPWLSVVGIVTLLFLALYMFNYSIKAWITAGIWIALGLVVYKGYAAKREIEHARKVKALERIERKEYSILVYLSQPEFLGGVAEIALAVARKNNGEIIFLHVIEVEEGRALVAGLRETESVRASMKDAESLAARSGIPSRSIIEVSHRVSQGIIDIANEESCNFIVIGRQKNPTFLDRIFSALMDTVLQKSPSEVAVLHGDIHPENIHQIIVPFGENIHTLLAVEMAPALAEYFHARIKVVAVFAPDISEEDENERMNEINQTLRKKGVTAEVEVVKYEDVSMGIIYRSGDADLILMGGRTGDFLELAFASSMTQEITEQVKCPVLWVTEYEERKSFWTSILTLNKEERQIR